MSSRFALCLCVCLLFLAGSAPQAVAAPSFFIVFHTDPVRPNWDITITGDGPINSDYTIKAEDSEGNELASVHGTSDENGDFQSVLEDPQGGWPPPTFQLVIYNDEDEETDSSTVTVFSPE
jgi:hypothetical protein